MNDGGVLLAYEIQFLLGYAIGLLLIAFTSYYFGRRASNYGIGAGLVSLSIYFIAMAWPIEPKAVQSALASVGLNLLLFGCLWVVLAAGVSFLSAKLSSFIKSRKF